jgi:GNAT superfamily N-acetyltransferase
VAPERFGAIDDLALPRGGEHRESALCLGRGLRRTLVVLPIVHGWVMVTLDAAMTIDVAEESMTALAEYALLPIAFLVDRVMDVTALAEGGFALSARRLDVPYVKDYDAVDSEGPLHWSRRFDVSNWALFTARVAGSRVGGATVAFDTPALTMLEGRRDLSVVWDIRVAPKARGNGIGSALFEKVEAWARAHSCRQLKVETQNINVPACRFYARQGCELRAVHHAAYPELPKELQLLWYKDLRIDR